MKAAESSVGSRMGGIPKRRHTGVAWATGILLLVVFVAVAAHHAEGRRFAELLRSARPAWLGVAVATGVPLAILGLRGRERSLPRWVQRLPWANEVFAAIG